MKKLLLVCLLLSLGLNNSYGQWQTTGLNNGLGASIGTYNNYPINIFTANTNTARFSTPNFAYGGLNGPGQGLSIFDPAAGSPASGRIDIFTSGSNSTEIRFGGSGNIAGRFNRFEMHGNYNGLFFNGSTQGGNGGLGVIKFARAGTLYGGLTQTNKWLFGAMTDNPLAMLSAARRVHVFDTDPQLRLSYGGTDAISGPYTDFLTNSAGHMVVDASGNRVGIETGLVAVGNTLHINSSLGGVLNGANTGNGGTTVPGLAAPTGATGLRFEDLKSTSVPMVNPGTGVLSVDANGDVIYVPTGGNGNPFVPCTSAANANLTANSRSNLNNFNLYFLNGNSNAANQNGISLGNGCGSVLSGKFDVENTSYNSGVYSVSNFLGNTAGTKHGVEGLAYGAGINYGLKGTGFQGATESYGVYGIGVYAPLSVGVRGAALHNFSDGIAYGGYFTATSPTLTKQNVGAAGLAYDGLRSNIGGHFKATSNNSTSVQIGVYGEGSHWAAYYVGSVNTTGVPIVLSDSTLKENIASETNAIGMLMK